MTTLSDQTTLVTGANRGLGREFVDQFLARDASKVYAAARDPRSITMHDRLADTPRCVAAASMDSDSVVSRGSSVRRRIPRR
jgi:NAD(P)-dependent dehydrogenase (short-subunit alcohol dehydrogenase family)